MDRDDRRCPARRHRAVLRHRLARGDRPRAAEWNRGAYLAEGLGHCGACHTPRNSLGAVERDRAYAGGEAEGWDAPVAHNLAIVPDRDVEAIATYIASVAGPASEAKQKRAQEVLARVQREEAREGSDAPTTQRVHDGVQPGAAIYEASCGICHGNGRGIGSANAMHLALSTAVALPSPRNLIHIVEDGVRPRPGERGRWMPAFRGAFTDAQLVELLDYVRAEYGPRSGWQRGVADELRNVRRETSTP